MWLWVLALLVAAFGWAALRGAPFLPVLRRDVEELLDLAGLQPGETLLDLGSGDGRLLRAAAKRGGRANGYEINPWLYCYSRIICWPYRRQVQIRWGDYWQRRWPDAEVIFVFLIEHYMPKLDR